jgi:hypothetical protein
MITVDQIRSAVQQVILSKISLDDFDEWLTKASWNMHKDSKVEAVRMVGNIELMLAEFDSGDLSERDLRKAFQRMAATFVCETEVSVWTSAMSNVQCLILPSVWSVASDKPHEAESSYILRLQPL